MTKQFTIDTSETIQDSLATWVKMQAYLNTPTSTDNTQPRLQTFKQMNEEIPYIYNTTKGEKGVRSFVEQMRFVSWNGGSMDVIGFAEIYAACELLGIKLSTSGVMQVRACSLLYITSVLSYHGKEINVEQVIGDFENKETDHG